MPDSVTLTTCRPIKVDNTGDEIRAVLHDDQIATLRHQRELVFN